MNEKKSRLRRRKTSAAARLRPFWLLVVLALALVVVAAIVAVNVPAMRPHTIVVRGNRTVSRDEILERAGIDLERNMWIQNTAMMAKRIEAIPYIDDAHIRRQPPDTIEIEVSERVPYAVLVNGTQRVEVDRALRVLAPAGAIDASLPQLVMQAKGPFTPGGFVLDGDAVALRDDNNALLDANIVGTRLSHDKYGDLVVELADGVALLMGDESDLEKKIPLVHPILNQVARAGKPITAVDLRAPSTPIVVYRR